MQRTVVIAAGALVAAVQLFLATVLVIDATREDRVADNVRVGSLDAGGMTRDEVAALLRNKLAPAIDKPVVATFHDRHLTLRPAAVRARLDVASTVDAAMREGRASNPFSRVLGGSDGGGTVAPKV